MKSSRTYLHFVFALLAAAFLTACADMQTGGNGSGYNYYGGGHGGHH